MKEKLNEIDYGDSIEVVDPKSADFQKNLSDKAGKLCDYMLEKAIDEPDDMAMRAQALNAYVKYKAMLNNDTGHLLDKLASLSDKQIGVLEKSLHQRNILDNVKGGKLDLTDFYNLPKKKKVKSIAN